MRTLIQGCGLQSKPARYFHVVSFLRESPWRGDLAKRSGAATCAHCPEFAPDGAATPNEGNLDVSQVRGKCVLDVRLLVQSRSGVWMPE